MESACLFERVDKVDDGAGVSRVGDEEDHLRPPVLDVVQPRVQHQQVLAHLVTRLKVNQTAIALITRLAAISLFR